MFTDIVIMAGGSGTRLWPASNSKQPKQFLPLPGGTSFFETALDRAFSVLDAKPSSPLGQVLIVAGASHLSHVIASCAKLPQEKRSRLVVIGENVARNTAPALACASVYIKRVHGEGRRALVLTSDHIIEPVGAFIADAEKADLLARQKKLVVFGIPPRSPETGFGYIEAASAFSEPELGGCHKVASFREKPDQETAQQFVDAGNFYWNSGMFGYSVDFMIQEFHKNAPATIEPFDALGVPSSSAKVQQQGVNVLGAWEGLEAAYLGVKGISIDYAIAEKCKSVAVVTASFNWIDIGSWDDYARFMQDSVGQVFAVDSQNCYVDSEIPVALCGVEDLLVVVRDGKNGGPPAVLICKKGESQKVKDIVDLIKAEKQTGLL
ncbi:hypothetical protein MASR2M78_08210 [Treponema sp.]